MRNIPFSRGTKPVKTCQGISVLLKCDQYFPVVLFVMLYRVVLTFESDDEILKCDHSNESY